MLRGITEIYTTDSLDDTVLCAGVSHRSTIRAWLLPDLTPVRLPGSIRLIHLHCYVPNASRPCFVPRLILPGLRLCLEVDIEETGSRHEPVRRSLVSSSHHTISNLIIKEKEQKETLTVIRNKLRAWPCFRAV